MVRRRTRSALTPEEITQLSHALDALIYLTDLWDGKVPKRVVIRFKGNVRKV